MSHFTSNRAVADRSLPMVNTQVFLVPEQAPLQPANTDPVAGLAVSFTRFGLCGLTRGYPPQSPLQFGRTKGEGRGEAVTLPEPLPE